MLPPQRLFFLATVVNIVLLGEGKAIQDWNFKFHATNGASKIPNRLEDENSAIKPNQIRGLIKNQAARDNCVGNCDERNTKKMLTENNNSVCPYRSKELCLIFSLSKIAKIQLASLNEIATSHAVKSQRKSNENSDVSGRTEESKAEFSPRQTNSSSVHCRAIRDVYVPAVRQNLPAFACQFGNNTFILSSARFLQDRRSHLDIDFSVDTLRSIKSTPKVSRSNEMNAIPALLVLNAAKNDYRVEVQENVADE